MFAPGLDLLQDFCRHGPTPEVTPVAMTLVVLLQQNGRVEELIRKLISWKLAAAARTPACRLLAMAPHTSTPH